VSQKVKVGFTYYDNLCRILRYEIAAGNRETVFEHWHVRLVRLLEHCIALENRLRLA
jgi:hypothetical protein